MMQSPPSLGAQLQREPQLNCPVFNTTTTQGARHGHTAGAPLSVHPGKYETQTTREDERSTHGSCCMRLVQSRTPETRRNSCHFHVSLLYHRQLDTPNSKSQIMQRHLIFTCRS